MRLGNPLVRAVLRSPAHRLLSGRLLVLTYRGGRSGRTFSIPLQYAWTGVGDLVVVAVRPGRKLWWRSFARAGRPATVLVAGESRQVVGRLATGAERESAVTSYATRHPRARGVLAGAAVVVLVPGG